MIPQLKDNEMAFVIRPESLTFNSETGKEVWEKIDNGSFIMNVFESDGSTPVVALQNVPFIQVGTTNTYYVKYDGGELPDPPAQAYFEFKETGLWADKFHMKFMRNVQVRTK